MRPWVFYLKSLGLAGMMGLMSVNVYADQASMEQLEYPFYARHQNIEMMILNSGIASLEKRLDMIRRAKRSIELEYFIYDLHLSSRLVMSELVKRAKEGIKIRILLDKSITVIKFDEYYADEVKKYGIEVRYYNRALDPISAQFRNHRKLLSIDDEEAITGGRNIGDEYFDMSPSYNFHDRDVWVKGSIVKTMVDSFNAFWSSERAVRPLPPYVPEISRLHRDDRRRLTPKNEVHERKKREASEFVAETAQTLEMKRRVQQVAQTYLDKKQSHICPSAIFVSDRPAGSFLRRFDLDNYMREDRLLNQVLKRRFSLARESVILESPYFILNESFGQTLNDLLERRIETSVLTNSLGSTDAIYVSSPFYRQIGEWIGKGLRTYVHSSAFQGEAVLGNEIRQARYGIHSKTFVIDGIDFTIGTYNVDNRSDYFNTEMTIFCEGSPELAKILIDDIEKRMSNSYVLQGRGDEAIDKNGNPADPYGGAPASQIDLMKRITLPTQWLEFIL